MTLSLSNALAINWLVPRLPEFRQKFPGIAMYLDSNDELVDFKDSEVDIGLRFHAVKSPGFTMFEKAAVHWTVKSRLTALRTRNVNEQLNADVWNSQQGTGMQATICQTTLQILQGIDWELFVLTALTSCTREFCA